MLAKPRVILALSALVMFSIPVVPTAAHAASTASQCYVLFQTEATRAENLAGAAKNPPATRVRGIPGMSHDMLKTDIKNLVFNIESNYGPRTMKQQAIGLVWEKFKNRLLSSLNKINSLTDYHYAVADAFNRLNDVHVSVSLPSTLTYSLPMQFSAVGEKVILNYLVPSKFDPSMAISRLPKIGDELIAVNGMSLVDYQNSNPYFHKYGNDISSRAFSARLITSLSESGGFPISRLASRDVTLTFKSGNETFDLKTRYNSSGIGLLERGAVPTTMVALKATPEENVASKLAKMLEQLRQNFLSHFSSEDQIATLAMSRQLKQFHDLVNVRADLPNAAGKDSKSDTPSDALGQKLAMGLREPFFKLPADFKELRIPDEQVGQLLNRDSFFVGSFVRDGKRIGFLRIPEYSVKAPETMLASIRFYIGALEASTDMLIIDQTSNPGGMVAMSDLVVKSLVGKYDDAKHMKFLVKPNQTFLRKFADLIDSVQSDSSFLLPSEKADFVERLRADYATVKKAFDEGADLSEPVSLRLMSEVFEKSQEKMISSSPIMAKLSELIKLDLSKPQVYTKKVYFMINEFDASGGDATPAVLQDYGRATLVGVRTMGAGGSVEEFRDRTISDIGYRLTTSLMYRKDGKLVENYGVKPDIDFDLVESDYTDGFANVLDRLFTTIAASGK